MEQNRSWTDILPSLLDIFHNIVSAKILKIRNQLSCRTDSIINSILKKLQDKLEKLIWSYRKGDIAKMYGADIRTLNNLIKHFRGITELPIEEPPKGY